LRGLLSQPEGDLITRFPGIWFWRKDFEALYWTYKRFVSVEAETTSGVSTLLIKAYRPEDAQRMARALLEFSEQLVNQLNERAHLLNTPPDARRASRKQSACRPPLRRNTHASQCWAEHPYSP